jgi:hypothetical protein
MYLSQPIAIPMALFPFPGTFSSLVSRRYLAEEEQASLQLECMMS